MKVKRIISVLVAAAMVSTLSVGYTFKKAAPNTLKGSITVLTHRTDMKDIFNKYAQLFEKQHPGTKVSFENITDYQQTLTTRMGTKDYGDVLMMPANITKDQFKNFYAPLGTRKELNKQFNYLDNFDVNGTVYGLSTGANANGIVYNAQVLKDAGIKSLPKTNAEFLADLKAIKEKTKAIPYYTNYVASWALTTFSNALQIGISGDPDYMNKLIYNKNEFAKGSATYTALNYLYEAVKNGYVEDDPTTSDWETSKQLIADGKIGFMALGSWAIGQFQAKSKTPQNIKFMPVPEVHNGKSTIQIGSDYGMGVNKYSKNIELAKAFVKFFVNQYPNDSNMISSVVGAKLPAYLSDAKNVVLVQQKPGTLKQAADQDAVQKASLINLNDGTWIQKIVEIGLGSSDQTFDQYMADLNSKWAKAIDSLGK